MHPTLRTRHFADPLARLEALGDALDRRAEIDVLVAIGKREKRDSRRNTRWRERKNHTLRSASREREENGAGAPDSSYSLACERRTRRAFLNNSKTRVSLSRRSVISPRSPRARYREALCVFVSKWREKKDSLSLSLKRGALVRASRAWVDFARRFTRGKSVAE